MAILGKIRQRSFFLIIVIGMALFAFVISGVFDNSGNGFGSQEPLAVVNDEEIDIAEFRQRVDGMERAYNYTTSQALNAAWTQQLRATLLSQQFDQLGIEGGKSHLENYLAQSPGFNSDPRFQNEAGIFDPVKFVAFIADLKKTNPVAYDQWTMQEAGIQEASNENQYNNLIKSGINSTQIEGKNLHAADNSNVSVQYVQIPFSSIADSLVPVKKSEITAYVEDNKDRFEVKPSRDILFVQFDEKPTLDDENAIKNQLQTLIEDTEAYNDVSKQVEKNLGLRNTQNIASFVNQHSDIKFDSTYVPKGNLPSGFAETLFNLEKDEVFGPYKDNGYFKITRAVDKKVGGSRQASHILVAYAGATNAAEEITRTKDEAQKEAQQLLRKAKADPNNFAELARENSDGPSKTNGGDLGFFQEGAMVKPFSDYVFNNPKGSIGLVETDFGFHVIEIKEVRDVVLLASVALQNIPSDKTSNDVFNEATKFEMAAQSASDFSALASENERNVRPVKNIQVLDDNLPGLSNQRRMVQWLFDEETQVGDLKRFDLAGGGYVVAQLTKKTEEGLQTADEATAVVLPILRNQKKAEMLKEKYKNAGDDLTVVAQEANVTVNAATALNRKAATLSGVGREALVVGTAFKLNKDEVSDWIVGNTGLFKVKVTDRIEAPTLENYAAIAKQLAQQQRSASTLAITKALEEQSSIQDNRALFY